ncbi:hypothetical protein BS47DRAFT_1306078 [Hydnum rufescens UP504]|uniref:THO complex subunit 1 n=1 Tax=Hydnum rufescens UP504 TaxID=1448309 RepID=A0A9P6AHU3_9AGAM|nr:hypothetical protein BS47DRAFT_1306078 [Hydnum rufescens UP504]
MTSKEIGTVLESILQSLTNTRPLPPDALSRIVRDAVLASSTKFTPGAWDNALRKEVFSLVTQSKAGTVGNREQYFGELFDLLDVVLTFQEQDAIDGSVPLDILRDLFDMHSVKLCQTIFDWLESRSPRLTANLVPSKGKALVLLRQLNTLVRRVSKTGDSAKFNGRILNFLSAAFPLGERSSVNLRGEYGPTWEEVVVTSKKQNDTEPITAPEDERAEFYKTFWSLQLPFSTPAVFQNPATMPTFKANVNKVLPVLSEATRKDRQRSGNKGTTAALAGTKRKRDLDSAGDGVLTSGTNGSGNPESEAHKKDYFFAKFLTNSDLLDLEISDLHFRRQILIQLLILFNHLLTYLPKEKEKWVVRGRGASLQMDFTLSDADAKWIRETWTKVSDELKAATAHVGYKTFQDTVTDLLERERAWVRWKNDGCKEFDRPPPDSTEIEEARGQRRRFLQPIPDLPHALGTEDLTEVWDTGYKGVQDLETPPHHKTFERYVRDLKNLDRRIATKEQMLEAASLRKSAVETPKPRETPPAALPPPTNITANGGVPKLTMLMNGSAHGLPPKPGSVPLPPRPSTPSPSPFPSAPSTPAPIIATRAQAEEPEKDTPAKPKLTDPHLELLKEVGFISHRREVSFKILVCVFP